MIVQAWPPAPARPTLSDSLALTGVAYVEKKPMATLLDQGDEADLRGL